MVNHYSSKLELWCIRGLLGGHIGSIPILPKVKGLNSHSLIEGSSSKGRYAMWDKGWDLWGNPPKRGYPFWASLKIIRGPNRGPQGGEPVYPGTSRGVAACGKRGRHNKEEWGTNIAG